MSRENIEPAMKDRILKGTPPPEHVPAEMWKQIRQTDLTATRTIEGHLIEARAKIEAIGRKFGYTELDLIERGVLAPAPAPKGTVR